MIWYLLVCSMIGGLSVSVTTGLGAAIVTSISGDNQVSSIQAPANVLPCLTCYGVSLNTGSCISS